MTPTTFPDEMQRGMHAVKELRIKLAASIVDAAHDEAAVARAYRAMRAGAAPELVCTGLTFYVRNRGVS